MKRLVAALVAALGVGVGGVAVMTTTVAGAVAATPADLCDGPATGVASEGPVLAARAAHAAGFRGEDLVTAVAVAGGESSYRPTVRNSIGASGLWQILQSAHPHLFERYDWRDPLDNARMAHTVWTHAGSWRPWVAWTSGSYRRYLPEARAAVHALGSAGSETANESDPRDVSPAGGAPTNAAGSGAGSSPVCPPAAGGLPPAPRPFTSPDGYVDDPTSSGRITRRTLHLYTEVNRAFGGRWPWGIGCWDPHPWNPTSDHPRGKACDFTVGRIGAQPAPADRAVGWQLAHWLQAYALMLDISYVIWDRRIWSVARAREGWRPYTGGGVYDVGTPTGSHSDHLHCSTL